MKKNRETSKHIGKRFGRLQVVAFARFKGRKKYLLCVCDCGSDKEAREDSLGVHVNSCGCLKKEINTMSGKKMGESNKIHGFTGSRFHTIWQGMLGRCQNKNHHAFSRYGGKGISVEKNWLTFENFRDDMYSDYQSHLKEFGEMHTTLDRIDNLSNYSKQNCRWATKSEQNRNTTVNRVLEIDKTKKTLVEWSEISGIHRATIMSRIGRGWNIKDAIFSKVNKNLSVGQPYDKTYPLT